MPPRLAFFTSRYVRPGGPELVSRLFPVGEQMRKYEYSWGIYGPDTPGGFWGVHQASVDSEGNFYTAEVNAGRFQKFRPRAGANPAMVIQPV